MNHSAIISLMIFAALAAIAAPAVAVQTVSTYHYDNFRTGWNPNETTLTPANVGRLGVLTKTTLDDQVDAQPLVVPNQTIIAGPWTLGVPGTYEIAYVVTESNTIYGINTANGAVLLKRTIGIGPPVPTPLSCNNNAPLVGITSTPVINVGKQLLYTVSYQLISGVPTYRAYAINLKDLSSTIAAVNIAASHTMSDGTTFNFNAKVQRQRPALLEANGTIYAAFGTFCDFSASLSRGWLLGWGTAT